MASARNSFSGHHERAVRVWSASGAILTIKEVQYQPAKAADATGDMPTAELLLREIVA